jgi:hypothetical protein
MKPITTPYSYDAFFEKCQRGKMSIRPAYYSGRDPMSCDLGYEHLTLFYGGFRSLISEEAAARFVRFINKLENLTASNFLVQFRAFFESGMIVPDSSKTAKPAEHIEEHSDAMAVVFGALGGGSKDMGWIKHQSKSIKSLFIHEHMKEIPKEEVVCEGNLMKSQFGFGGY